MGTNPRRHPPLNGITPMTRIQTIGETIDPLRSYFDTAIGYPRFLALVSPTCDPCLQGAAAVRDEVVPAFHEVGFPTALVWIPMLDEDSMPEIERVAPEFGRDGLEQFADPKRSAGHLVAESLGGTDSVAWDVYLFYGPDARWTDGPPEPVDWVHQLGGYPWASPERYRCGTELTEALGSLAREMIRRYGAESGNG